MWAQTRDRAAAMLAHVVVSIGKLDAVPTDRRCDHTWSWHHHRRRRPVLGSSAARQNDALWTRVSLAMVGLFVNRTQWVVLSAINEHPWCGASRAGPGSARPAPTARFNLWPRFCPNYSHNEPCAGVAPCVVVVLYTEVTAESCNHNPFSHRRHGQTPLFSFSELGITFLS